MNRKKIWEKKKNFSRKKSIQKPKKKSIKEFKKLGLIKEGTFIGNHKGFGFVELEEEEDDIFIPADATGTAMHHGQSTGTSEKGRTERKTQGRICDTDSGTCQSGDRWYFPERKGLWIYHL